MDGILRELSLLSQEFPEVERDISYFLLGGALAGFDDFGEAFGGFKLCVAGVATTMTEIGSLGFLGQAAINDRADP